MRAPGGPGAPPSWGPGRKDAFGAAPGLLSRVWLTLARGNLSEVYFPTVDRPVLNGLRFLVSAPGSLPLDDAFVAEHKVSWLRPGVPAFTVESRHREYRLTKDYVTDPGSDAVLISGAFEPELPDLRLFLQADPHLVPGSTGNQAAVLPLGPPVLVARQGDVWMAIVGPFNLATVGYLNSSDLYVGLHDGDGALLDRFEAADAGNVALGAEIGVRGGPFQLAIGFAHARAEAEEIAREALRKGAGSVREAFERAWLTQGDLPGNLARVSGDGGDLARCSLSILRCLEDKSTPGAFIAAPAAPWGEHVHDGNQIYHLVWPRDLCQIAGALVDAGDHEAGLRALRYLERMQFPEGSWRQNFTVAGEPHWTGLELDEVGHPILLAWRLAEAGVLDHDPYPEMVRRAAVFLVRNGPTTPLDRWEDGGGLSPSTLAIAIAALIAAAEFADRSGEHPAAIHLGAVADYWQDRVEAWCYSAGGGYYARLGDDPEGTPGPYTVLGLECVELVRRGIRAADHPLIVASLRHTDDLLRVDTPAGPAWRRYGGDAYGEREDGSAWGGGRDGRGRAWPVLTGERAHYELARGAQATALVRALEGFAGPAWLLPEQIWDGPDLPRCGLLAGGATGSARPLGWAHAEYLKVLAAIATARSAEVVEPARRRYAGHPPEEPAFIWSAAHAITGFTAGRAVTIQLDKPGVVRWSADGWESSADAECHDTGLGLHVAELPTRIMRPGAVMNWTARYADGTDAGRNYELTCREDSSEVRQ
ncbi:MAG: glycoside hydrolase family 15 protein [Candidatus Dormibacteraceae bacterium]